MSDVQTLALQTAELAQVPTLARVYLWTVAVVCVFISLCMGMMVCAGPNPSGASHLKPFTLAALVTLALHIGYLAAPLAARASWWKWSFWAMAPLGGLIMLGILYPMINSLRWTPPDGASRLAGLSRQGILAVITAAIYAGPPAVLWWLRSR